MIKPLCYEIRVIFLSSKFYFIFLSTFWYKNPKFHPIHTQNHHHTNWQLNKRKGNSDKAKTERKHPSQLATQHLELLHFVCETAFVVIKAHRGGKGVQQSAIMDYLIPSLVKAQYHNIFGGRFLMEQQPLSRIIVAHVNLFPAPKLV